MSTVVPPKGHRHTRSAAMPPASTSSQNPQNPHHLNSQAHALNAEMNSSGQPTTPSRTPRKNELFQPSSQTKTNTTSQETESKQKTRNKRPKNVMTSPAATRTDRNTPPLTGAQSACMPSSAKPISTPSTAAYAGPTFHASPAPSALPIPSFYSKSVPDSPGNKGHKSLKESSLLESPSPVPPSVSNAQFPREESPLDFFFKADREERARARSASSTQNAPPNTGPFKPPAMSPRASQTPPGPSSHGRPRNPNRISSSGMFAMELDGESTAGTPFGPAFSTPYSERINAARSSASHGQLAQEAQQNKTSEALKAYLFSDHQTRSPASSSDPRVEGETSSRTSISATTHRNVSAAGSGQRGTFSPRSQNGHIFTQDTKTPSQASKTAVRSSGLRQEVTPTRTPTKTPDRNANSTNSPTPFQMYGNSTASNTVDFIGSHESPASPSSYGVPSGNRSADIKGMEDSLRKMLKLDSNPSITGSGISAVPAAAASVPNYVGGRPPPMNGTHNDVMGKRY